MPRRTIDTRTIEERKAAFLAALANKGTITLSAKLGGMARSTVYLYRSEDADFAAAWDDAQEQAADKLEQSMYDRALKGDTVAGIFMLKAMRPLKFRERLSVSGADGRGPLAIAYVNDWRHEYADDSTALPAHGAAAGTEGCETL